MAVAHISIKFGLRDESTDRVNDNNVKSTRLREGFNNFQSLLTVVRLRDDEVFNVDSEAACVREHECVLRIHNRRESTFTLSLCNDVE